MLDVWIYMIFAAVLLGIGIYGVMGRKNMIKILLGIEIMASGVNLSIVVFSVTLSPGNIDPLGQVIVILFASIGSILIAVGVALAVQAYNHYRTLNVQKMKELRG